MYLRLKQFREEVKSRVLQTNVGYFTQWVFYSVYFRSVRCRGWWVVQPFVSCSFPDFPKLKMHRTVSSRVFRYIKIAFNILYVKFFPTLLYCIDCIDLCTAWCSSTLTSSFPDATIITSFLLTDRAMARDMGSKSRDLLDSILWFWIFFSWFVEQLFHNFNRIYLSIWLQRHAHLCARHL